MPASALVTQARRAQRWLVDDALPYWATRGFEGTGRGFFEAVAFDASPLRDRNKRVRVQARQIYVMSHAALLGWKAGLDAAEDAFSFLLKNAWSREGGFVHILKPDGAVADARRDTYDHAFILLALAWYHRVTGSQEALHWLDRTWQWIDRNLWEEKSASYREQIPDAPPRRQNPHMHMFEACLTVLQVTGDARAKSRAEEIVALFETRFFEPKTETLREYFDPNWTVLPGAEGRIVEPGHHCEWVWLLKRYEERMGKSLAAYRRTLQGFAHAHGQEAKTGLLFDEVRDDGQVLRQTMRCWPQTEALKAALVGVEESAPGSDDAAARICEGLFSRYLSGVPKGLWRDQFDAEEHNIAEDVPASTFYHLFLAFAELMRVAGLPQEPLA